MKADWRWQEEANRQKHELIESDWDILLHLFLLLFPCDSRHFVLTEAAESDFVLSACSTTVLVPHPWEEYLKNKVCFFATTTKYKELCFLLNRCFKLHGWFYNTMEARNSTSINLMYEKNCIHAEARFSIQLPINNCSTTEHARKMCI